MVPDHDHWSAGMLLRWVLIRDRGSVLAMVDPYGMVVVEGDSVTRVQPEGWDDVLRAHSIDESLPTEEKAARAVVKAEMEIIPAQKRIYSALRRGELDGWARPNGSGAIVRIEPIQWTGLRFRLVLGRDIAIPIDSEFNPLPLPRPLSDYVTGLVPPHSTPTVWPDPLFSGEQATRLWPTGEPVAAGNSPPAGCPNKPENIPTTTGLPGRPSKSKYLIDDEFERRIAAGDALSSLSAEAEALLTWLKASHPDKPRPTSKTIQENIRGRHRRWQASRQQPTTA
jgi:hypothetical protein